METKQKPEFPGFRAGITFVVKDTCPVDLSYALHEINKLVKEKWGFCIVKTTFGKVRANG